MINVYITVEDIETKLLTYSKIELERSTSPATGYAEIAEIALLVEQFYYSYPDDSGTPNHYYRYRFSNAGESARTNYSNPFRPEGITRLKVRQEVLNSFRMGMIFTASGGDTNTITTNNYRIKSSAFRAGRGKGSWVLPTTGNGIGQPAAIKSTSDPSTGTIEVENSWPAVIVDGDEIEWHRVVEPDILNECINLGLKRYWYVDRVPVNGIANANEYSLSAFPWIIDKKQVAFPWYYPDAQGLGAMTGVEAPWGGNGSWWNIRQDEGDIKLLIHPTIPVTQTIWLEAVRRVAPLHTDDSVLPNKVELELVKALAWDEVLAYLCRPGVGAGEDLKAWKRERIEHSLELKRLLQIFRPRPRVGIPNSTYPDTFRQPVRAR